jgi:hypothetical protein
MLKPWAPICGITRVWRWGAHNGPLGGFATYSGQAGSGTLVIEARDSMSGALLTRGVDKRRIGDTNWMISRSSVSNRSDFARAFRAWAGMSVQALANLKAMPPLAVAQN